MEALLVLVVVAVIVYLWLRRRNAERQQIPTDHMPDTFVVIDLETTGLDAGRHEIIEIAAIRYKKGTTTHDTFQALVKPSRKVPSKITEITGITQAMLDAEGEPLAQVLQQLNAFVGSMRLVTFNAEFDMAFLDAAYEKHGFTKPSNPVSCALKMARRAWPQRKTFRLDDLANDGDFAEGRAHRALEDARRALIVYAAATAKLGSVS
jgi:DNA polymerase III subunit epsilon